MEERHKIEINAIHEKYEQKINEFMNDKQKYEPTIINMTKSIRETREKIKETTDDFQEISNMAYILKNENEFAGELISSFDNSTLFAQFKEQINNNPKMRKLFIEFMQN